MTDLERALNRERVLRFIRAVGIAGTTADRIARSLGLTPAAAGMYCRYLQQTGAVKVSDGRQRSGERGRQWMAAEHFEEYERRRKARIAEERRKQAVANLASKPKEWGGPFVHRIIPAGSKPMPYTRAPRSIFDL